MRNVWGYDLSVTDFVGDSSPGRGAKAAAFSYKDWLPRGSSYFQSFFPNLFGRSPTNSRFTARLAAMSEGIRAVASRPYQENPCPNRCVEQGCCGRVIAHVGHA